MAPPIVYSFHGITDPVNDVHDAPPSSTRMYRVTAWKGIRMGRVWQVIFYQEHDGAEPARCFLDRELTVAEKAQFWHRVGLLAQKGLQLLGTAILEKVKDEDNLYTLRLPKTTHNPRFLLCT